MLEKMKHLILKRTIGCLFGSPSKILMRQKVWLFWLVLALILSACLPNLPVQQAATEQPSPSPQPTATYTPEPITTVAIPDPVVLFEGLPVDAYEEGILAFLNAGGQPYQLVGSLSGPEDQPTGHRAWTGDVNGDGRHDLAAGLIDLEATGLQPPGQLLIFLSTPDGQYERTYEWTSDPSQGTPQVEYFQDMDADGQDEIIASAQTCGAHTCFLDLRLLDWDGATLVDATPADTAELPQPQLAVEDPDADGVLDLVISPSGVGSAGAGPYWGENQRWTFGRKGWTAASEEQPPQYLIHAIHKGDDLLSAGRLAEAREWYAAVVDQDPSLHVSGTVTDEVDLLSSFAVFRLVQVALNLGEPAAADELLATAENSNLATSPGEPYFVLAQLYRQAFDERNPTIACEVVLSFIQGREAAILLPLGSQTFGYANRDYTVADFCPPIVTQP